MQFLVNIPGRNISTHAFIGEDTCYILSMVIYGMRHVPLYTGDSK